MTIRRLAGPALILCALPLAACATSGTAATGPQTEEEARLVRLASDIQRRGDSQTAVSLYQRAVQVSGNSPGAHMRLAKAMMAAGDLNGSEAAYRSALQADSGNAEALLGLGTVQLQAGSTESAARSLAAAAPAVRSATAYNRLGTAYVLSGNGKGAQAAFAEAARLDPNNLDTLSNLALAEVLAGQNDSAVSRMRSVTGSALAEPRHFRNLVLVLTLAGRDQEAAAVNVPDLAAKDEQRFVRDARKVRAISQPAERAKAIGLLASA